MVLDAPQYSELVSFYQSGFQIHSMLCQMALHHLLCSRLVTHPDKNSQALSGVIDQTKRFIAEGYHLTVAETVLHNRMAYQHAMTAGLGLLEFEPKGAAAEEIRSLFREVIRYAGIEVSHQTVTLA